VPDLAASAAHDASGASMPAGPPPHHDPCPLAITLARRLRDARGELTARWLERIVQRVALDPNRVFPTDELLDHVPLLLAGVADYIEDPARAVHADSAVMAKAMELGALRHQQGFDAYEVLKEYELLGGILFAYFTSIVDALPEECSRGELFVCAHRVFHAVSVIQQATTMEYLQRMTEGLRERDERLRAFNRTLAHEFRNRIGAARGAAQLLETMELPPDDRRAMAGVVARNVDSMRVTLDNLLELSRVGAQADGRQQRHVLLPRAAAESVRTLRDFARSRQVEVRLGALPEMEVSAAAVELCLTNLVSNAIKYADAAKPARWVAVDGAIEPALPAAARDAEASPTPEDEPGGEGAWLVVRVHDNGLGVPAAQRTGLFRRFFRAHEHSASHIEGTGLGLSIVRETMRALGGHVWAEFPDEGAVFALALPARRAGERPAAPAGARA
jgi:signal transduction histidine kinase